MSFGNVLRHARDSGNRRDITGRWTNGRYTVKEEDAEAGRLDVQQEYVDHEWREATCQAEQPSLQQEIGIPVQGQDVCLCCQG